MNCFLPVFAHRAHTEMSSERHSKYFSAIHLECNGEKSYKNSNSNGNANNKLNE